MPLADYSSYDPDFSAEQVGECARLVDGLRAINEKVVRLSGSLEELSAVADGVESLSAALDAVTQRRAMETFRHRYDTDHPKDVMPFNPATGPEIEAPCDQGLPALSTT